MKVFSEDEDLPVKTVEIKFLNRKILSSIPEQMTWHWPKAEDKDIIEVKYIFMGPCTPDLLKNGAFKFDDVKANELFKRL